MTEGLTLEDELLDAAQRGDVSGTASLIRAGADVNVFDEIGLTPLHHAAMGEHLAVVELLLASGANVNARHEPTFSDTPLGKVAGSCSLELARILVKAGANPSIRGWMQLNALDRAEKRLRGPGPAVYALLRQANGGKLSGGSK